LVFLVSSFAANAATVLVVRFHNESQYSDLSWVGESVAETLRAEFGGADEIVLDRDSRAEGLRRLSLRPDAGFTKATLIRLGQTLDADYVCFGSYEIHLAPDSSQLKDSSIQLTARFIDLKKMHEGPEVSEAGKLTELSRLEEHLAWQSLKYLEPGANLPLDRFMSPQKLIRVDAKESYIRGLLSSNKDQQEKWFAQALALDAHFSDPAFELGRLALNRQEYAKALNWFQKIPTADPRYPEARFKMGLCAYGAGDYTEATNYFREVLKTFPLGEVYNNLGAAENRLNLPIAIDDFRRAADGDQNDTAYLFNLGLALMKNNYFDEAAKRFQAVLDHDPDDAESQALLARAQRHETPAAGAKTAVPERLKQNFNETAFRQLKAVVQSKGN
jgi:tetratricopeptide (TPR) repeat protein